MPLTVEALEARCTPTTVTNLGDVAGDPNSLRGAIAATPTGGTVDFAVGLSGTITLTTAAGGQISIAKDLTIQGPGAGAITVQAAPNARIFDLSAGGSTVAISGLTISGGQVTGPGGAISSADALTITSCVISGNSSGGGGVNPGTGGGIFQQGSSLTIQNSTICGNAASTSSGKPPTGGGVSLNNVTATIQNSTISGNSTINGGGVYLQGGTATFQNSTISANSALGAAGGVYLQGGTATFQNSTISGNTALLAGGAALSGTVTIQNSTISGNSAFNGGGV